MNQLPFGKSKPASPPFQRESQLMLYCVTCLNVESVE
jgi:hypothetical protein